ncbi:hypothetical protein [Dyadobacter bucti]|uniref:hypothetical protein n=1 Tax=Dyadobacter bucti TaxID=2572203 RepID=UPI00110927B6|nr:hypothetical protein [Dyadobacter bucti]
MLYLDAMKISRNISEKKSVINCLLLAILSAGIFLLHETGAGRPAIQKETIPIAAGFPGKLRNIPGIYEVSTAASNHVWAFKNNSFQFLILEAISKRVDNITSVNLRESQKELHLTLDNLIRHFHCWPLISEDPLISFS